MLVALWVILVLYPLFAEITLLGINVKKEIEEAKTELKAFISDIHNSNTFQPVINISTSRANSQEYQKKAEQDIAIEEKEERGEVVTYDEPTFRFEETERNQAEPVSEAAKRRLQRTLMVEKEVSNLMTRQWMGQYQSQVKITEHTKGKSIIVDGVLYEGDVSGPIKEIVEIKLITEKSFPNFHYILSRTVNRLYRFGLRIPVRFIVVSEEMNTLVAKDIIKQLTGLINESLSNSLWEKITIEFFKFEEGKLIKVAL